MVKIQKFTFHKAPSLILRIAKLPQHQTSFSPTAKPCCWDANGSSLWIIKSLHQNNSLTTILDIKSWIQHSWGRRHPWEQGSNYMEQPWETSENCPESLQSSNSNPLFMWVSDAKLLFASAVRVINVTISQSVLSSTARLWRWTPSNRRMKDKHSKWQIA